MTEVSLSGTNIRYSAEVGDRQNIHTPELTTLGVSAKGWIRLDGKLSLHKVGKYEIPADQILSVLEIPHIHYKISSDTEVGAYLTEERKQWIEGVGEAVVNSELFTSEEVSLVTFEEFAVFCRNYGLNPYHETIKMDREAYLEMQIADYILNNNDRHEQNWGFLMENVTGKLTGLCPLFDHDHAFVNYKNVMSQTTEREMSLREAALRAQHELEIDLRGLSEMDKPTFLSDEQWRAVQDRRKQLTT